MTAEEIVEYENRYLDEFVAEAWHWETWDYFMEKFHASKGVPLCQTLP